MSKQKRTHEIFIKEVESILGNDYTVMSKFEGRKKEIKIFHSKCGKEYITKPDGILSGGRGCPFCRYEESAKKTRKKENVFIEELDKLNINLLSSYKTVHQQVDVECQICDYK
jgi:hypothetical protein